VDCTAAAIEINTADAATQACAVMVHEPRRVR
jgi:hypothetical protein